MKRVATVLYEDRRGVSKNHGPHLLALAGVAQRVGCEPWPLRQQILGVPKNASPDAVADAVARRGPVEPFVLDRNLQTVLQAAAECGDRYGLPGLGALARVKNPTNRDSIVMRVVSARSSVLLKCIEDGVPSWARLVSRLATLVQEASA